MKHTFNTIIIGILSSACTLWASDKPAVKTNKATVTVTKQVTNTGSNLLFSAIPGEGLVINSDGPWKLEIKSVKDFTSVKKEFKRDEWKTDISGFSVPITVTKGSKSGEVEYKMTTFVCTKDKSMCYREVVEGKSNIVM